MSAKCEGVGLDLRIEKLYLKNAVRNGTLLAHELVETLPGYGSLTIGIDIRAVIVSGRFPIDGYAEPRGFAVRPGAQDKMQIARVEPKDDASTSFIKACLLGSDRPIARPHSLTRVVVAE